MTFSSYDIQYWYKVYDVLIKFSETITPQTKIIQEGNYQKNTYEYVLGEVDFK